MQVYKQQKSLGLIANFKRQIKPGTQYNNLFPKPDFSDTLLLDGNVDDTVHLMGDYIKKYQADTAKLAPILKGKTLEETLRNNWNFVYNHIQYQLDTPGIEELRRPARSWVERKTGVDCDCYTIFLSTLLLNQGITPIIRIVQIPPATSFHHVYPIVYKSGKPVGKIGNSGDYYTLDAVLDRFNYEKPFSKKRDYTMYELGIPIKGLHGLPANKTESTDDPILARLVATRDIIESDPASIAPFEDPKRFLKELDYAIKNWNTSNRSKALQVLAQREKLLDETHPLNGLMKDVGDNLEHISDEQKAVMNDLLSGTSDSLQAVKSGEELGRVLLVKDKRLKEKQFRLSRKLKSAPRRHHRNISRRINSISRLRSQVNQIQNLDQNSKNKVAQLIRQTYNANPNSEIQSQNTNEASDISSNYTIPKNEVYVPEISPSNQDLINQSEFTEYYIEPEPEYAEQYPNNAEPVSQAIASNYNYENEPYDDWQELVEDHLDNIEDQEDEIMQQELQELNGLGSVELGAFWNKRKKRLELKEKRQEKRLNKAEKKGKTKRVEQLKLSLKKNQIKQKDPGQWKGQRKEWRKDNKRGFWQGIQRTGQGAIDALVKFNPLSVAARNGFLVALKLNVKKMSSRLKWGYASKEEVLKKGMSLEQWEKSKKAVAKVEDLFAKKFKGDKNVLKKTIIKAGKGLNGLPDGLGVAPAAAVAAATPIILAVVKILKETGLMNKSLDEKKLEEDLKAGVVENNDKDVEDSKYDDVELDIEAETKWHQTKGFKIVGIVGGGLLVAGLGYMAYSHRKKQIPTHKNGAIGSIEAHPKSKQAGKGNKKNPEPKKEPIKEITLT